MLFSIFGRSAGNKEGDGMGMRIGENDSGRQAMKPNNTERMKSVTKSGKKKKKRLQYNFKEISTQIMLAKTSVSAGGVIARAQAKVAMLQRKLRSEEYDSKEVERALGHAKKMEAVARKKKKHLAEEEKAKNAGSCLEETERYEDSGIEETAEADGQGLSREQLEEMMAECQEAMDESMEEFNASMEELNASMAKLEDAMGLEQLADEFLGGVQEELSPEDLEQLKKKHRAKELREIMEADMKYLKALFDQLEKEKQGNSGSSGGISLQLGGMEIPVQAAEVPVMPEGGNVDISL